MTHKSKCPSTHIIRYKIHIHDIMAKLATNNICMRAEIISSLSLDTSNNSTNS